MATQYDVRIYKSFGVRNLKAAWLNTYVFNAPELITDPLFDQIVAAVVSMEKIYHLNRVQFLHATVSTKANEPTYVPESLRVFELDGQGNRGIVAPDEPIDLNICLKVKKQVAFGRSGMMFFRGCLLQSDIDINDRGEAQLAPVNGVGNPGDANNAYGMINNLPDPANWIMADKRGDEVDGATYQVRNVLGIAVAGVSLNKRDHKYFDRPNAAPVTP